MKNKLLSVNFVLHRCSANVGLSLTGPVRREFSNGAGFTIIELLVVMGIFTLIAAASFSLISTGRFSADIIESRLKLTERSHQAMSRITRELRLSSPSRVYISNTLGTTTNSLQGEVINFQIPVGCYDNVFNLTPMHFLKWGSQAAEGAFLAYSVDANSQLLRSTYTTSDGTDASSEVIAQNISSLNFSRSASSSQLVNITISFQEQIGSQAVDQTLHTGVRLMN